MEVQRKLWNFFIKSLNENYPGIQIAGMYSPPFRPMTEEEDKAMVERINEVNPDFVWVGLGAPKQEKWMAEHHGKVNGLMIASEPDLITMQRILNVHRNGCRRAIWNGCIG